MPSIPHLERHFTAGETVRDVVIRMSDGLTVPFALAGGLSGAIDSTGIVVTAGLAEMAAGSIAMGLGGATSPPGATPNTTPASVRARKWKCVRSPPRRRQKWARCWESYGLTAEESAPIVQALCTTPGAWVDFMMRFELGLEPPDPRRALTIAGAYVAGGFIPLGPYLVASSVKRGLCSRSRSRYWRWRSSVTSKGAFTGTRPVRSAIQTKVIGGLAAAAVFAIARVIT